MNRFFVTGTDTDVGKTITSSVLTLALEGYYWKPIQSGHSDQEVVKNLTGLSEKHFFPCTYNLKEPLSPNQAAELENITIDVEKCVIPDSTSLIVEGVGGAFVPLNNKECSLDLMKKLNLPVIVVSRGTLGTINHTLLTIESLRQRGLTIKGIIFCGKLNPANQKTIEQWSQIKTLFHIPFFDEMTPKTLQAWTEKNKNQILENLL